MIFDLCVKLDIRDLHGKVGEGVLERPSCFLSLFFSFC